MYTYFYIVYTKDHVNGEKRKRKFMFKVSVHMVVVAWIRNFFLGFVNLLKFVTKIYVLKNGLIGKS